VALGVGTAVAVGVVDVVMVGGGSLPVPGSFGAVGLVEAVGLPVLDDDGSVGITAAEAGGGGTEGFVVAVLVAFVALPRSVVAPVLPPPSLMPTTMPTITRTASPPHSPQRVCRGTAPPPPSPCRRAG